MKANLLDEGLDALARVRDELKSPLRHDPIVIGVDLDTIERVIRALAAEQKANANQIALFAP